MNRHLASRIARWFSDAMAVGAAVVFAVFWLGLAYSLAADATLPDRAWAWLRGLEPAVQFVAWVAMLPIAVGLWTWTSSWPPIVGGIIVIFLLGWTAAAVAGLRRIGGASQPG